MGVIRFLVMSCFVEPFSASVASPILYILLFTSVRWWNPFWPARAIENLTCAGCHDPMQATLRRPLCVLRGSFRVPQREVTPEGVITNECEISTRTLWCTLKSTSFGDANGVNDFKLLEHILHCYLFLKILLGPLDLFLFYVIGSAMHHESAKWFWNSHLVGNCSSVHLDLHDVGFFLTQVLEQFKLKKYRTHIISPQLIT